MNLTFQELSGTKTILKTGFLFPWKWYTLLKQVGDAPLTCTLIVCIWCSKRCTFDTKWKELTVLIQIKTGSSFNYRPDVYSVQVEVKPVLSLRVSCCFGVNVGNLMSALLLTLQHQMALSNTFIHYFPQNEINTDVGIIFKQQQLWAKKRAPTQCFGKNFSLHSRTFRRVSTEVSVARGRFVNCFDVQVWSAEGGPRIIYFTGEGQLRIKQSSLLK